MLQHQSRLKLLYECANKATEFAQLLRTQLPHENRIWVKNMCGATRRIYRDIDQILEDVKNFENNGRAVTWPRNSSERRQGIHTMGFHLNPTQSSTP
jgi:hypothetical protein